MAVLTVRTKTSFLRDSSSEHVGFAQAAAGRKRPQGGATEGGRVGRWAHRQVGTPAGERVGRWARRQVGASARPAGGALDH